MHTFLIRWYNNIMHIFLIKWSSNIMHIFLIKWSRNLMHTFLMKAESSETWRNLVHQRTPATGKGEFGVRSSHASPSSPTPVYVPFLPCESFTTDPSVCTVPPTWVLHHRPQGTCVRGSVWSEFMRCVSFTPGLSVCTVPPMCVTVWWSSCDVCPSPHHRPQCTCVRSHFFLTPRICV